MSTLPDPSAWRIFTYRLLNAAGVGSLGAGVIFFVAANWTQYGNLGRFAIIQAALIASIAVAWWRPPPSTIGESTVALATLLTGALLALFGQSYQTGADLYELFFIWALLAIPFALATRSGATWAIWWVVVNIGLGLVCGLQEANLMRWLWSGRLGIERPTMFLAVGLVKIVGAAIFVRVGPAWISRVPNTFGFGFGTVACILAITHKFRIFSRNAQGMTEQDMIVIAVFAIACAAVAAMTLKRKADVYPMALICASWIAISTAAIITTIPFKDLGSFFLVGAWLIGTSTAAGFLLMGWVRAWR
jgi:uncharacterized membrane protein